jgi:hypothetical protein
MARPKPRVVSPEEVKITRENESAIFTYSDSDIPRISLTIGPDIGSMTDEELLDLHNETVEAMLNSEAAFEHIAWEVPIGKSQIEYEDRVSSWSMKGDVLRGVVGYGHDPNTGEPAPEILVDDKRLSWSEFGKMLSTYEGWGLRLTIVPEDEIHRVPDVEVLPFLEDELKN